MGSTDIFRTQHDELLGIAGDISKGLNADSLGKDASNVRNLLSDLAGKLTLHLALEDKNLYPTLVSHNDPEISTTTKKFIDEMGGLASVFMSYNDKWSTPDTIQKSPQDFISETGGVFKALADRIDRENNELYVLMDKIG